MQKFLLSLSDWQKKILQIISFVFVCALTAFFVICCGALFISNIDTPENVLIPLTTILLTVASFIDSLILAKIMKENGLYIGLSVGAIFTTMIILLSLYYGNFALTSIFATKTLSVLFAGILGGIMGVNI